MLIGLFLFSSCKDNNTIGLPPDGSTITGDLYDNTTLTSRTMTEEPIGAAGLIRYPIGIMHDPIFGESTAGTAMVVNMPTVVDYRFGKNVEVDSAVLVLPYAGNFYGDSTQNFTFTVRQLNENLALRSEYLSSTNWGDKTIPGTDGDLGQRVNIKQYPNSSFKVVNIVTGKPDTSALVAPQLRIKLDPLKIQNRIAKMDTLKYSRNDLFVNTFNGVYVNVTSASGPGAMSFFNLAPVTDVNNGAKLQIYYKKDGLAQNTQDTVSVIFPIDNIRNPVVAYVKHDYTGTTTVKEQLADLSPKQYDRTYVQGLTGLKNKITFDFSAFKTLTAGSKVAVNKAELVIDVDPADDAYFKPAQRLRLVRLSAAGLLTNVPDNDRSTPATSSSPAYYGDARALATAAEFGGYFDSVNRRYVFSITAYIQDLLDGKTKDYGTFISPTAFSEFSVSPFASTADRSVLYGPVKDAPAGTKRMKLNIFYTKLKTAN